MTDRIKSAREAVESGIKWYNGTEKVGYIDLISFEQMQTILEALSAYERLQGVDFEELADAVQILETWDTSRDGYIKPNYFPMRDVLKAAQLVADIRGK